MSYPVALAHPDLVGWDILALEFDFGDKWGVAIQREADGKKVRWAVRVPDHVTTPEEALELALPALKQWASEHGAPA